MIVVLVEGDCEKYVLPILAHRVPGKPIIKCIDMRGKSNIVRVRDGFEATVRRQVADGERSFIVLMDGDVTSAPYNSIDEEQREMHRRTQVLAQELGVEIQACWAVIETESWLIGGIQSGSSYCGLRGVAQIPANTETIPPDPKRWLREHLRGGYDLQAQRCLARHVDLDEAQMRNRSMRTFFGCFAHAGEIGSGPRRSQRRR
jgi:OLD-like protein